MPAPKLLDQVHERIRAKRYSLRTEEAYLHWIRRFMRALLARLDGTKRLAASLLYSTGMRLLEGLRLRVKDIDFERREIVVRGKDSKDRSTHVLDTGQHGVRSPLDRLEETPVRYEREPAPTARAPRPESPPAGARRPGRHPARCGDEA